MKNVLPPLSLLFLVSAFAATLLRAQEETPETVEALRREAPFAGLTALTYLKTGDPLVDWNSHRLWTSREGKSIRAKLLGVKGDQVALETGSGPPTLLPRERLSEADQTFIREWEAVSVFFNLGYEAPRSIAKTIEPGIFDGAFAKEGKVHETRNFRFECDAVLTEEVVKDFSRLFEVTYLGVLANPLGLALAQPEGGKFQIRLFSREADYLAAGGSAAAAGVYLIKERLMLVPLASLGLTGGSSGYKKTRDFDPRTLIHETTHALTHQWLAHAPMWFIEGFAEYIAAIPYHEGRLELAKQREGLLALTSKKFGGDPTRFPLIEPAEFTAMSQAAFMGEPEPEEKPIDLPRIEPFQITLVSHEEKEAAPEKVPSTKPAMSGSGIEAIAPGFGIMETGGEPAGPLVVRRYLSSMALVHYLFSSGQTAAFRQYLFDFARNEWERDRYLTEFEETHRSHHAAVEIQIRDFDARLRAFNVAIDTYNAEAARYNRREIAEAPKLPAEPVIPAPLPVPKILAAPRSAEALSRRAFLKGTWDRHLKFEGKLSVDSFR